jgi:hypothetical protein
MGSGQGARPKQWTVMVYLAGDNDLDAAGVADLEEMKAIGSTGGVSIVAQFDRSGRNRTTNRYLLQKGTTLGEDLVTSLGETNTGDPAILRDFVVWAAAAHPAKHYMLVIWNHGSGWDDSNLYEGDSFSGATPPRRARAIFGRGVSASGQPVRSGTARAAIERARRSLFRSTVRSMVASRAIAFDDQAKDFLDSIELKRVLAEARRRLKGKIDILGFDACLMSMAEVAYQFRDSVSLTCGSEEEEPGDGWPYDTILKALTARPSMTPPQLAKLVVDRYLAAYEPRDGVTLSAANLAGIDPLASAIHRLGLALLSFMKDRRGRDAIVAVRSRVQEYSAPYDQYCDLGDLCELLVRRLNDAGVERNCGAVRAALGKTVIAAGAKGINVAHSHGMSVYFPKKRVSPQYATLDFAKRSGWATFIDAYVRSLSRRS